MRAWWLVALGLFVAAPLPATQPQTQRFTVGVEAVRVDALVTDGRNPIAGLTAADFELRDNGVVQPVRQVDVEQLPLNVILALDTSQSLSNDRLGGLVHAVDVMIDALRAGDRAAVLTFTHQVELHAGLTADRARLHAAVRGLESGGGTAVFDATFASLALRESDAGRTLLLLLTDGEDTASWLSEAKVRDAVKRSDAIIYVVAPNSDYDYLGEAFLKSIIGESGGRGIDSSGQDLSVVFKSVLDEFKNRYVLGYTPTGVATGGWHEVRVRLKTRKGTVTARRGYFAQ